MYVLFLFSSTQFLCQLEFQNKQKNSGLLESLRNAQLFEILYVLADRNCKSRVLTKLKLWKRGGDKRRICFAVMCLWHLGYHILPVERWRAAAREALARARAVAFIQKCCVMEHKQQPSNMTEPKWGGNYTKAFSEVRWNGSDNFRGSGKFFDVSCLFGTKWNSFKKIRKHEICW